MTATYDVPGMILTEHEFSLPLDHGDPHGERITVFAREVDQTLLQRRRDLFDLALRSVRVAAERLLTRSPLRSSAERACCTITALTSARKETCRGYVSGFLAMASSA